MDRLLSPDERLRVDLAEGLAYQALYAAASSVLKTGSQRLGDVTLLWHPLEDEAGYNCLVNFHLAADFDATFAEGQSILARSRMSKHRSSG